ncbi:hypothetical protein BDQ12DRAFT_44556 [Crucibulum laeve]|uniref:Uncharacterized protein n=1 Tax=Crucibulum laeve TaxID=68775 RepID=A0A5C3MUB7_9AGAR|nr:hypothetical protein BDQ12DRAFT_44556 [Crucibulum laeve]
MATTHSFVPQETFRFRLSDAPRKSSLTCSLTLDVDNGSYPHSVKGGQKACHISFNVGSEDASEEKALEWLKSNLKDCSIQIDEDQRTALQSPDKMQYMVKGMASLWADALVKKKSAYVACPTTASSSSSSSSRSTKSTSDTVSVNGDIDIPPLPSLEHSADSPIATRVANTEYGSFYLQLLPGASTSGLNTPVATGDVGLSNRRSYFDDQLVTQLSSLQWQQVHQNEPPVKVRLSSFHQCSQNLIM